MTDLSASFVIIKYNKVVVGWGKSCIITNLNVDYLYAYYNKMNYPLL